MRKVGPSTSVSSQVLTWKRWAARLARSRLADPILSVLRKGIEPSQLALSAAIGFTMGLFPIFGFTAALCGLVAFFLRSTCNAPVMMVANLAATPFEISKNHWSPFGRVPLQVDFPFLPAAWMSSPFVCECMIVPFIRFGEYLLGSPSLSIHTDTLMGAITGRDVRLLSALGHALLGWLVLGPIILIAIYCMLLPLMQQMSVRFIGVVPLQVEATNGSPTFMSV